MRARIVDFAIKKKIRGLHRITARDMWMIREIIRQDFDAFLFYLPTSRIGDWKQRDFR